jgi:hypothetical protein
LKILKIMSGPACLLALGIGPRARGNDACRFEPETGALNATHVESSEPA